MNSMVDAVKTGATLSPATVPGGTRILVVEDDFDNVMLLRAYLNCISPSLDFALNGLEALEKRCTSEHELILMDMQMPVMDGYTATREIRTWEKANGKRRAPILALSAHAIDGAFGNSIQAGCDGHITKPVERQVLLDKIAEFARPVAREEPRANEIALRAAAGATDGISESIKARRPAFLANRWLDLEKLQASLSVVDYAAMRTIAHNCKGIGTGYGFPEITSIGLRISTAAKAFDNDKLRECLRDFEACLRAAAN
jgi:CheY-like chemotaxis protein